MRIPIRPVRGRWPSWLESVKPLKRFFRLDPLIILDDSATPEAFREAMSSIYVGGTIKITGSTRHPQTDQLLIDTVDLSQARIADIGASDGSTSVDLITRVGQFAEYVIADLYLTLRAVRVGKRVLLFDQGDSCVLVGGPRVSAWPALSKPIAALYRRTISRGESALSRGEFTEVLLLNPETRRLIASDPRVTYRTHDVFNQWEGPAPTVVKVANLLRRLYFSDADLSRALAAIHASVPVGGHLMIVDNPRLADPTPRAGIWLREPTGFTEIARVGKPEIADLVSAFEAKNV